MDNPPEDGPCEVTITAPDREWLETFVRQLVVDRLAAAAHVDTMATTYRWSGEIRSSTEARARLHTMRRCLAEIERITQQSHPFEVPCVAATPLYDGLNEYLSWVNKEARH